MVVEIASGDAERDGRDTGVQPLRTSVNHHLLDET